MREKCLQELAVQANLRIACTTQPPVNTRSLHFDTNGPRSWQTWKMSARPSNFHMLLVLCLSKVLHHAGRSFFCGFCDNYPNLLALREPLAFWSALGHLLQSDQALSEKGGEELTNSLRNHEERRINCTKYSTKRRWVNLLRNRIEPTGTAGCGSSARVASSWRSCATWLEILSKVKPLEPSAQRSGAPGRMPAPRLPAFSSLHPVSSVRRSGRKAAGCPRPLK